MSWSLENQHEANDKHKISDTVEFTIGRKDCNLNITNDKTVSRKHAIITITPTMIPYTKSSLTIRDVSSYGTYVNRNKCDQNKSVALNEGDKLMFGSPKSTFWVRFNPLVVTSSCLKNSVKYELEEIMKYFNGEVVSEWSDKCSYLVMDNLSVTIKVICILAAQYHIVTIGYFKSLKEASEKSLSYPDPKQFRPKLSPNFVIKNETFEPNPLRKTLFSGMTFYFLKYPQWRKMKMAIELAGGDSCQCLAKSIDDLTLLNNKSIVMQAEASDDEWISHVQSVLERHNKRFITDAEIGQAILCCSTEMYCNPNATLVKTLSRLQSQTMAFQTQQSTSTHTQQSTSTHTQNTLMFVNRSNKSRDTEKKHDSSIKSKAIESSFLGNDASRSKHSINKRSRSPNKPENSPAVQQVGNDNEPSKKKSRLLAESVSDNINPVIPTDKEPSVPVLVPDSLSQVPFIKPKPILVIEDSDPEDILSENEDQSSKNVTETSSDKLKQSNLSSCIIDDSELTQAASDREIQTAVIKKEVVDPGYESKKKLKTYTLDLLSEESQLKDRQEKITESPSKFTDVFIKSGYLNTKKNKMNTLVKVKQEVQEDEDLPKACTIISFTSLVLRKPKPPAAHEKTHSKDAPKGFVYYKGVLVRNFKNFCKNSNSGAYSLPRIIGGCDLVIHNPTTNKELDDWFKDANEKESQENEDNKRIEELFNWGPKKKGHRNR